MPFYSSSCPLMPHYLFREDLLHLCKTLTVNEKKRLPYTGTVDNVTLLSWMWLKINLCMALDQSINGSCSFESSVSKGNSKWQTDRKWNVHVYPPRCSGWCINFSCPPIQEWPFQQTLCLFIPPPTWYALFMSLSTVT